METLTSPIRCMDSQPASGLDTVDAGVQLRKIDRIDYLLRERDTFHPRVPEIKGGILILESRVFLRECLQRSIQTALSIEVETLSSIVDLKKRDMSVLPRLIIISIADDSSQESLNALGVLSELTPS